MAFVCDVKYWNKKEETAVLNKTPPVQNTWYIVLNTVYDPLLYWITIKQVNDEAAAKDVNMRWTIDGMTWTRWADYALGNNTTEFVYKDPTADGLSIAAGPYMVQFYSPMWCQQAKIEARITSVPGTNQILYCTVCYGLELPT